jgi:hypothetical protein
MIRTAGFIFREELVVNPALKRNGGVNGLQ